MAALLNGGSIKMRPEGLRLDLARPGDMLALVSRIRSESSDHRAAPRERSSVAFAAGSDNSRRTNNS